MTDQAKPNSRYVGRERRVVCVLARTATAVVALSKGSTFQVVSVSGSA